MSGDQGICPEGLGTSWAVCMILVVYPVQAKDGRIVTTGNIVPAAAVWMESPPQFDVRKAVHVRTLESSNSYCSGLRPGIGGSRRMRTGSHDRMTGTLKAPSGLNPEHTSQSWSILDHVKQWFGGAIFGAVIFLGILLSQPADDELSTPTTTGDGATVVDLRH